MSLFKRSGIYLLSNILNALIPFLLLPVLTRNLSTGEYGQIAMFQTLITGLAALVGLNTIGAANRKFYDGEYDSLPEYNGACVHILFISILVLGAFLGLFANYISSWLSIPVFWIYLALAISFANFIIQFRLGQWQIREQALKFGAMQVSQSILNFVFSVVLVVIFKYGAQGRVDAILGTTVLYALFSILLLYKNQLIKLTIIRKDYISDALSFGLPLVPHVVGMFLLNSLDRFFINKELGIDEAGVYMFAVQLSLGVAVVFDAINKAMITWLFKSLADNRVEQLKRVVRFTYLFFVIVFLLGCLSFFIGPLVVSIVGGYKFEKATEIIGWLCLGQCFGGMYLMVTNYLFYAKKTGRLSVVTIATGILNIILLLILLQVYGIVGVAMSFAISMCIRFFATWWITSRLDLVSWKIFQ
ncbi:MULTISPECIES: lipopolysaccharide biosynthesis protein [Citrobacter]|uniref:lipopolysaccharide biosynthesis protein n=1 Tax=Citrobacter TaxID=544 RepID=UPI0015EAAF9E|nr:MULTISPECIES: oligosaccharide flippase family protein [Citrobacter]EHG7581699.1 oligosaccharide flippase family protein [Citrobacter sedlakii]EIQ7157117.1 oligosaccharide flippase family protein [Citrobacter sedlakii]MBN6599238.1 oligosaccharide flippase family protein [Citrobacter sedlakii]QMK45628.1 oligosaccharide flippase family protein [Citrobacter sp. RHB21-C05]QMK64072.1 oligosaccharide flippase family protein [Citrobacter sp. RHB21-C01]